VNSKRSLKSLAIIAAALTVAAGCSLDSMTEAVMVSVDGQSLTLAWDPPSTIGGLDRVAGYSVWYKRYSSPYWTLLGEIPAYQAPQYTVSHERVGDGLFVFAVSSIDDAGRTSEMHSSLDWTASPMTGWYVSWMRKR